MFNQPAPKPVKEKSSKCKVKKKIKQDGSYTISSENCSSEQVRTLTGQDN